MSRSDHPITPLLEWAEPTVGANAPAEPSPNGQRYGAPDQSVPVRKVRQNERACGASGRTAKPSQLLPPISIAVRDSATPADVAVPLAERVKTWCHTYRDEIATYAISTVFHALLALVLGLIVFDPDSIDELVSLTVSTIVDPSEQQDLELVDQPDELVEQQVDAAPIDFNVPNVAAEATPFNLDIDDLEPALQIEDAESIAPNVKIDFSTDVGGRAEAARAALVRKFGGTEASEAAVAAGLKWLAGHQNADGSWNFLHVQNETCRRSCTHPGIVDSKMGGTAMALLAFLGAGQTHTNGKHQDTVRKGLEYLLENMEIGSEGGDLRGSSPGNAGMYVQGLASIALGEGYALTKDPRLAMAAQYAVQFISSAQHPTGGGWRYEPRQNPGDTSVVGWQIMALRSAQAGRLRVPLAVFRRATGFLNSVEADGGAQYGYTSPATGRDATTAVGLLCRMYLGWKRDNPALKRGVELLSRKGPDKNNMYYNYYATQVLHHWGGEEWKKWNEVMRDHLVDTQEHTGHAAGSWVPVASHSGQSGGRLYMTCMAVMTLEVYYRHLPLYQRENIAVEY